MKKRLFTLGKTSVSIQLWLIPAMVYAALTDSVPMMAWAMLSIALHEASHAVVSALFGSPPQEIELTPMGAVMHLEDDEALPMIRRMLTILAGPLASLLLCAVSIQLVKYGVLAGEHGRMLFMSNVAILMVNLLPVWPLDGGRMLALMMSVFMLQTWVGRVMRLIGWTLGTVCIALNLWINLHFGGWNLSLSGAGCFLIYSASTFTMTRAMKELRMLVDRKIHLENRGIMRCQWWSVTERLPLRRAVDALHPDKNSMFTVNELGTQRHLADLSEQQVIAAYMNHPSGTIMDCLHAEVNKT